MSLSSWFRGLLGSRKPEDDETQREEYGGRDLAEVDLGHEGLPGQDRAGADIADDLRGEFTAPPDPNP